MTDRGFSRAVAAVASAAAALMLSLTGCTNPDNTDEPGSGSTRSVADANGDKVAVPAEPERVVALSEPTLDAALALGVTPVGTTAGRGQSDAAPAYLADHASDIELLGPLGAPDLERLLALEPDLILTDGSAINDPALLRRLDGIAPTVWVGAAGNADWQKSFELAADALGVVAEAGAQLKAYDERATEVASALGDPQSIAVSVVRWGLASGSYLPPDTFPGSVVAAVGLARPSSQRTVGSGHSQPVSLENLRDLDADWMFFSTLGGAAGPDSVDDGGGSVGVQASRLALKTAKEVAVGFAELPVVRADRVVPVDGSLWGSAGGPLAALAMLDDLEEALTQQEPS